MTNYEMEKQRIQANYDAYIKFAKEEMTRMEKEFVIIVGLKEKQNEQ